MARRNSLRTKSIAPQDDAVELPAAESPKATASRPRQPHVPVFRQSQEGDASTVALDQKTGRETSRNAFALVPMNPSRVWESIPEIRPDTETMIGNGLFPFGEQHPVTRYFDILRTRVLQAMSTNSWTRLAITSPTHGCGNSFVAANLALSLARLPSCRTVLLDLELRAPSLAGMFGLQDAPRLSEFLSGNQSIDAQFLRIGSNLALGLNGKPVPRSAEAIQNPEFGHAMDLLRDQLQPDVIIFDTPPVTGSDDVIALTGQADAVLLVADGTVSTAEDIAAAERMLEGRLPLIGVVLNRAQDRGLSRYTYGRR